MLINIQLFRGAVIYIFFDVKTGNFACQTMQKNSDPEWISAEYNMNSTKANVIATTWRDGPYLLVVKVNSSIKEAKWNLTGGIFNKKMT